MIRQGGVVVTTTQSGADLVQLPATAGALAMFSQSGAGAKLTDSVFTQLNGGLKIVVGLGAIQSDALATDSQIVIGRAARVRGARSIAIGDQAGALLSTNAGADQILIGTGASSGAANTIAIGTSAGPPAVNIADSIQIGRTASARASCIAIGLAANSGAGTGSIAIGAGADGGAANVGGANLALGRNAVHSGGGGLSIAIGNLASVTSPGGAHIAIGNGASINNSSNASIAIGNGAVANHGGAIAIGPGAATSQVGELAFGAGITLVTVVPPGGVPVRHRNSAGGWAIRNLANTADILMVDESLVAGDARLLLWDVTAGALKRVKIGPAGSGPGGVGQALWV